MPVLFLRTVRQDDLRGVRDVPHVDFAVRLAPPSTQSAAIVVAAAVTQTLHRNGWTLSANLQPQGVAATQRGSDLGRSEPPGSFVQLNSERDVGDLVELVGVAPRYCAGGVGRVVASALEQQVTAHRRRREKQKRHDVPLLGQGNLGAGHRLRDAHAATHAPRMVAARPPVLDRHAPAGDLEVPVGHADLIEAAVILDRATMKAGIMGMLFARRIYTIPADASVDRPLARRDFDLERLERLDGRDPNRPTDRFNTAVE